MSEVPSTREEPARCASSEEPGPLAQAREERIQRFTELNDEDQDSALAWFDLIMKIDQRRYRAVMDLLYRDDLSRATKNYLLNDVLNDDIMDQVEIALREYYAERDPQVKRQ